ncbi:MAG: DNRLRE domain-containing protein [Candidatus Auribacterota bacterium]
MRAGFLYTLLMTLIIAICTVRLDASQVVLQPGPADGKDASIVDSPMYRSSNFSDTPRLWISNTALFQDGYWEERALMEFNLSSITDTHVDLAVLRLHTYYNLGTESGTTDSNVWVHRVTESWTETGVTWNNGYDIFSSSDKVKQSDPFIIEYDYVGWVEWDVTSIVNKWLAGTEQNYGFMFIVDDAESANPNRKLMLSSDSEDAEHRPMLILTQNDAAIPEPLSFILLGVACILRLILKHK